MIKVLLADDFAVVRILLRQLLEKAGDIQVVAMASNGQEAVKEAVIHCPHLAVMDISMPIMDGLEASRQICVKCPETRVLIVSTHHTPQHIHRSIEAGALGYVLKDCISHDLVTAIRALHQGKLYFSRQIAELAKLYIHGETRMRTNSEIVRAFERLKRFESDIPLLFFSYAVVAELIR